MAENTKQFFFNHKAVVEDLIKRQGLHEGLWMLTLELGLKGANVKVTTEEGSVLTPAGILAITGVGITRTKEANDLTVDAAEVNPIRQTPKSTKRPSKKGR